MDEEMNDDADLRYIKGNFSMSDRQISNRQMNELLNAYENEDDKTLSQNPPALTNEPPPLEDVPSQYKFKQITEPLILFNPKYK